MRSSLLLLLLLSLRCSGFNLEPRLAVVKEGPPGSYFGFAVEQHQIIDRYEQFYIVRYSTSQQRDKRLEFILKVGTAQFTITELVVLAMVITCIRSHHARFLKKDRTHLKVNLEMFATCFRHTLESSLLVGAPLDHDPSTGEPDGVLWKCPLTQRKDDCRCVVVVLWRIIKFPRGGGRRGREKKINYANQAGSRVPKHFPFFLRAQALESGSRPRSRRRIPEKEE